MTAQTQKSSCEKIAPSVTQQLLARAPELLRAAAAEPRSELALAAADLIEEIAQAGELLARAREELVRLKMRKLLAHAPKWLSLTPAEMVQATRSVRHVLDDHPAAEWWELLWCLTVDGIRSGKRGKKPKWFGVDGILFAAEVEATLAGLGFERSRRKGLTNAVAALKAAAPERYGSYSDKWLVNLYYEVLARHDISLKLPGKSDE